MQCTDGVTFIKTMKFCIPKQVSLPPVPTALGTWATEALRVSAAYPPGGELGGGREITGMGAEQGWAPSRTSAPSGVVTALPHPPN